MVGMTQGMFWLFNNIFNPEGQSPAGWVWFLRISPLVNSLTFFPTK